MQVEKTRNVYDGPVNGTDEVVFAVSREESEELLAALKVVDRFKKAAFKALKVKTDDADWTMVDFCVKKDRIIVEVRQGACG